MHGLLLDSNIARAVAPALKLIRECDVVHLADWRLGAYLDADDPTILTVAAEEDRVVVSHDVSTMPEFAGELIAAGKPFAGAVFAPESVFAYDIGALVRALADLLDHPERLETGYPIVYLQPVPRRSE